MELSTLLAILAVSLGIGVQAWVGIGFGLVSAPLLYWISPDYVPGPILVLGFVLSALVTFKHYREICWQRVVTASIARIPGAWLGAMLLISVPSGWLGLILGSCLLLALLVTRYRFTVKISPVTLRFAGFSSGVMGTATSVGGPPMAMLYRGIETQIARNELALFFLLTTPISIVMLAVNGLFNASTLVMTLPLLPGVFLGYQLANAFNHYLDEQSAKGILFALCLLAALSVLAKAAIDLASP